MEEVSGETEAEIAGLEQIIKVLNNNLSEINIIKGASKKQKIDFNINHVWITGTISNFISEKSSFDVTVSREDNEMLPCNIFSNLITNNNDQSGNIKKVETRKIGDTYWAPVYIKHGYSEVCKNKLLSEHHESCEKEGSKSKSTYCLKIISTLEDLKDRKEFLEKERDKNEAITKEIKNLKKEIKEEEQKKPLSAATCNFKIQEGEGNLVIKEHESYNIGKFGLTRDRKSYPCMIAYDDVIRKYKIQEGPGKDNSKRIYHKIIFKMQLVRDKKIIKIKTSNKKKGIEGFIKVILKLKYVLKILIPNLKKQKTKDLIYLIQIFI